MRDFPIQFAQAQEAPAKRPRAVVAILFDTGSIYCTSHDDITSVPGIVLEGVLREPAAISQRLHLSEGRSEIGSFSFSLVDVAAQFTDEIRAKLADQAGLRRRQVQLWLGHEGFDFTAFELFQTQLVVDAEEDQGVYTIQCNDITREARKNIFEPKTTTLRDNVSVSATTIPVYLTTGFETIVHGTSWTDAPGATVGYIKIESEVIRYTGKTADSFTGCTRGVLNTKAAEHTVDAGTAAERRTPVAEYIYLELNAVTLAYAVLTGTILGTANVLPSHWHAGIDPALIVSGDFTSLGPDLYKASDANAGLVLQFEGLKKTEARRFLEKEVWTPLNCFPRVYANGSLGVKRLPAITRDAGAVATLTDDHLLSVSALRHRMSAMANVFRIEWNYNVPRSAFTRRSILIDADSITENGEAPIRTYEFRGLHGSRHTDSIIAQLMNALRDAYSYPPEEIEIELPGSLLRDELGDVVRVQTSKLRDYAGPGPQIDRAFLVTNAAYEWARDRLTLSLFGSTLRPGTQPTTPGAATPLPDAFYTSAGANLNTIATITANVMATGTYTITGNADLTNAAAIFYWNGDLTIPNGCNLTIEHNVQLRIRGFLTLNGTINGVGTGHPGVADPGTPPWDATFAGNPGYVGHTRGWDGIRASGGGPPTGAQIGRTIPAVLTHGLNDAAPLLNLQVSGSSLIGLPTDLRGGGGAPGGRIVTPGDGIPPAGLGGTGGAGGAGFAIICRGMSPGVSTNITLNGADTANPALYSFGVAEYYPGAGAPGAPGTMLLLLDGNSLSIPDITAKFFAVTGTLTQAGNPMIERTQGLPPSSKSNPLLGNPYCGFADPAVISGLDMSNAAHRIQYIPETQTANPDVDANPPAPTGFTASHVAGGNLLVYTLPDLDSFDVVEMYASIDNNRANSIKVGETRASTFLHSIPLGGLRYYWIRAKLNPVSGRPAVFSEWNPVSSTAGESSNIETPGELPDAPADMTATGKVNGIQFNWSLPAYARLLGLLQLYEYIASTPFSSATKVWEGYALGYFLSKSDTTTRYYWLVLNRGGILSVPEPPVTGFAAAALSFTSALTANASPTSLSKTATLATNPATATTASTTVTASGGTPAYTYAWTWFSGGTGITINSPTAATTTFTATHNLDGTILTGTARCTVTDSLSATATADVAVQIVFPSIA